MIGLDTSAIIDIFKGNEAIKKKLLGLKEPLTVTQLSYLELMFGIDFSNKNFENEIHYYDTFFNTFLNFQLTCEACKRASQVSTSLTKKGKSIGKFDCTIAGIFLANGVNQIITKNVKHFQNIPEIKIINY
ncbi:MAG: type II toxin-antitoxin system VapC family toxin [Nanoarchaeota archaeon]